MTAGATVHRDRRVRGFDGLRACAALLVIAYHAGNVTGATSAGILAPLAAELKAGVVIFFVISGFLLYLPYARALGDAGASPGWRGFAWRRAIRILPGYWVALTLLAAVSLVTGVFGPNWWRFYTLSQIYTPSMQGQGLGVAWTLCVEVSFYLALPVFAWAVGRIVRSRHSSNPARLQLLAIGAVAVASLSLRTVLAHSLVLPVRVPVPGGQPGLATALPGVADWFAVGMALAVLRAQWEGGSQLARPLKALANHGGACWWLAALLYLIGVPLQHGELFLSSYGVATHAAIGVAAALFVLPAVRPATREQSSRVMAILTSGTLAWAGTISYGVYLWHVPFRSLADRWMGQPRGVVAFAALFVVTLAGGVLLGAASWYLVEHPAQKWGRKLGRQRARNRTTGREVARAAPEPATLSAAYAPSARGERLAAARR